MTTLSRVRAVASFAARALALAALLALSVIVRAGGRRV